MFNIYFTVLYFVYISCVAGSVCCRVSFWSKSNKSVYCRGDVNYIGQFLQVCTFFTGVMNLSSVTGFIVYCISI